MQAGGGDTAEVSPHIAAKRQPGAVAHQQATDQGGQHGPGGGRPADGELSRPGGRRRRPQHDAEIHHRGDIGKHAGLQCTGEALLLPKPTGGGVPTQQGGDLCRPKGEPPGDTPGPARQHHSEGIQQGQDDAAHSQRPEAFPRQQTPPVTAPQPERQARQEKQLGKYPKPAPELQQGHGLDFRQLLPNAVAEAAQEGARGEGEQGEQHHQAAAADRVEGAASAAALLPKQRSQLQGKVSRQAANELSKAILQILHKMTCHVRALWLQS